ncbi:MAG: radical SAM protein, partial [Candidatus Omnitrophica bacterium]|nr:radical SAM protein [Candidatus Omnitrophota bacterium]
ESLRSAGLYAVKYGVESSDQNLLDGINKNMDIRKTRRVIEITQSLGIKTHLTFTFGLPGETAETAKKTLDFAISLDPDSVQFSITTAFPGTKYFEELEEKGRIVSRQFSDYDGNATSILRTEALSAGDLVKARDDAKKMWQFHVWNKRHSSSNPVYYLKSFFKYAKDGGLSWAFAKSGLFMRYKLGGFGEKVSFSRQETAKNLSKLTAQIKNKGFRSAFGRIKNYYLELLGIFNGAFAFCGPECVQIDLTYNCNNNCIGCWCNSPLLKDRAYKGSKKYKTLPTPLVKELIEELAELGTRQLYFSGGGEPFMHPDIIEIIDFAKKKGLHCSINTNFTLVNEFTVKKLIELGLDYLTVSVWSGNAATYAATHPNKDEAAFYKISDMLLMLNSLKNGSKPYVKVYNVISNINFRELTEMYKFAKDTKSESLEFTVVDTIPGATDALILSKEQRQFVLQQCENLQKQQNGAKILNLEHFMRRLSDTSADKAEYDSELIGKTPCYIGWAFARIMPNGDVNSCLKSHRIPVGNLYEKSFKEIWNSAKQVEFRRKALRMQRGDPYFALIGNDQNCKIGCYKSCDDLGRNQEVISRLEKLNFIEKSLLRFFSGITKIPQ